MSIFTTLIRIEARKTVRRFSFWVSTIVVTALLAIGFGADFYTDVSRDRVPDVLPTAWPDIVEPGPLSAIFASVLIILLVANEFTWKTARQNVIDGLSKEQFFLGKLLLVPGIALLFWAVQVVLGGAFGLAGNFHAGDFSDALIRAVDVGILFGFLLQVLGFVTLGFLASMIARSPGASMGVMLLYVAILEQLLQGIVGRFEATREAVRYFPVAIFGQLANRLQWYPEALAEVVARATARGRPPPEVMNTSLLVTLALVWMGVLVGVGFLVYRKRDL